MDMNMKFTKRLPIPMEVKKTLPIDDEIKKIVESRDEQMKKILSGEDDRLILIIGPCSADNEESVMDYLHRLKKVDEQVKDKIFIVPRIYTNKPRTNGDGYKGLLHQAGINEVPDMYKGIIAVRRLHIRAIKETGFTCADEMLYPENHRHLNDLLGYVAVGARSVEDQQHRLVASGLNIPVGMKNPTSGNLSIMLNAIHAGQSKHTFIYRNWEVHTEGNPYTHAILRGYSNNDGRNRPNYHYEDLLLLSELYDANKYLNKAVIIDANHSNSNKNPFEQPRIVKEVLHNCKENNDIKKLVKGFMIESYLEDGNQKANENIYGKSITDPCLGWQKSEELIYDIANLL